MEHAPQFKRDDEEYPLLKVEVGGGDGKIRNTVPASIITNGTRWNVTCTPKQSWCTRWPEFVSAVWMTLIILAITFLVFYALGMSAYRRQPIVIVRCNDTNTKPGSDVFYHHIVARDAYVPFTIFSEYLSFMATHYPSLRFNVYFLIDDSWQLSFQGSRYPNPRILRRLVPHVPTSFITFFKQNNKRDIWDFQKKYQNVNIIVLYLSQYMAMTPLKYKWKMIPQNCLPFYARIYEIWQNGGIGFDLVTFNNLYNHNKELDRRVDTILKQHNNGFEPDKYRDVLEPLHNDEQNELFSMFFNLINHILNETRLFFDTELTNDVTNLGNNPLIRTPRNRRNTATDIDVFNITKTNVTLNNSTIHILNETLTYNDLKSKNLSNVIKLNNGTSQNNTFALIKHHDMNVPNISRSHDEMPQVWLFYDISGFSEDSGPTYFLSKSFAQSEEAPIKIDEVKTSVDSFQTRSYHLSLSPDGHFVAASSRHHPFLAQLLSSSCHRLNPKYAIKDTLLSQCSGFLRNDIYCENIRIMYNVI